MWFANQGPAYEQNLALSPAESLGLGVEEFFHLRMNADNLLNSFVHALFDRESGQLNIFSHREFTENPFILEYVLDALQGNFFQSQTVYLLIAKRYGPGGWPYETAYGLQKRGFACPVSAYNTHKLGFFSTNRHVVQHLSAPIMNIQIVDI